MLFDKDNPQNPINRRISIIVMTKDAEDSALKTETRPEMPPRRSAAAAARRQPPPAPHRGHRWHRPRRALAAPAVVPADAALTADGYGNAG